jgi:mannosyltransferase OCH1-like enzyme
MIPKIIHQIWIGPKSMPEKYMDTWKYKNPDWKYMRWTDETIKEHYPNGFKNQKHIDEIEEWAGKADIMRYEILHDFGGFYADADSICVNSLDYFFLNNDCFAGFENEKVRPNLVANGYIGSVKGCRLMKMLIDRLKKTDSVSFANTGKMAWENVGPLFFTKLIIEKNYQISIYPSYMFIPEHYTGEKYQGSNKIYARQLWGSTQEGTNPNFYNELSQEREAKISIVIPIYKIDDINWFKLCVQSIDHQTFKDFEVIIVNDGSPQKDVVEYLDELSLRSNYKIIKLEKNSGIGFALNEGIKAAKSNIIARMDADDIMIINRLELQYNYMMDNPDVDVLGAGIVYMMLDQNNNWNFTESGAIHPETITKEVAKSSFWYMNHPTVMYKKSSVMSLGGYSTEKSIPEDYLLWTRMINENMNIKNLQEILVGYRISPNQFSSNRPISQADTQESLKQIQSTLK